MTHRGIQALDKDLLGPWASSQGRTQTFATLKGAPRYDSLSKLMKCPQRLGAGFCSGPNPKRDHNVDNPPDTPTTIPPQLNACTPVMVAVLHKKPLSMQIFVKQILAKEDPTGHVVM